jgi:hypothetical protein
VCFFRFFGRAGPDDAGVTLSKAASASMAHASAAATLFTEPLGRGAFDALDVGAAHEVDAAGGSDRLVSLRAPLLVVDILSCSDGPQDGLSVSETRQHAQLSCLGRNHD